MAVAQYISVVQIKYIIRTECVLTLHNIPNQVHSGFGHLRWERERYCLHARLELGVPLIAGHLNLLVIGINGRLHSWGGRVIPSVFAERFKCDPLTEQRRAGRYPCQRGLRAIITSTLCLKPGYWRLWLINPHTPICPISNTVSGPPSQMCGRHIGIV